MRREIAKHPDASCSALAERQYGAIERSQALGAGLSASAIDRRVASGRWKRILPRVYIVNGTPNSWRTLASAACLWGGPGTVISHGAAAFMWNLSGFDSPAIEVTSPRRLSQVNGITIHRRTGLGPGDQTVTAGIPVTSIHRTLLDLGDTCPIEQVQDALDSALRRGTTSAGWLQRELQRVGIQGRKGPAVLRKLLEGDVERPTWLERRFVTLLSRTHLPPYEREYAALGYRLDFAWPSAMLAVEIQSEKWHRRLARWNQDLARHNELTAAGWTILHFTWEQIKNEPRTVIREIIETYRRLTGLAI